MMPVAKVRAARRGPDPLMRIRPRNFILYRQRLAACGLGGTDILNGAWIAATIDWYRDNGPRRGPILVPVFANRRTVCIPMRPAILGTIAIARPRGGQTHTARNWAGVCPQGSDIHEPGARYPRSVVGEMSDVFNEQY
jgi:hypothetical protein